MSELHDELRKLAEKLQQRGEGAIHTGPSADVAASIGATIDAILSRFPDPPGELIECGGEAPPVFASKIDPPATDEKLREKVGTLIETVFGVDGVVRDRVADQFITLLRPSPASDDGEFLIRIRSMLESVDWEGDEGPNNDDLNRLSRMAWGHSPPASEQLREAAQKALKYMPVGVERMALRNALALSRPPQEEIEGPFTFDELVEHTSKEPPAGKRYVCQGCGLRGIDIAALLFGPRVLHWDGQKYCGPVVVEEKEGKK